MNYTQHIQIAIDYIESNLQSQINLSTCAKAAGYSEYHFLRIFKEATGMTPGQYIRKRRLSEIAKLIHKSDKFFFAIAMEWGFNSYENFVHAFKTEHNITPKEYKTSFNSLHLYEKLDILELNQIKEDIRIEPQIVDLQSFHLYGHISQTSVEKSHTEIPHFWNKYNCSKAGEKLQPHINPQHRKDFGIAIIDINAKTFNYFIGVKSCDPIHNTYTITIPRGTYAVFKTPTADSFTFVETIHQTWDYILNRWLPNNNEYTRINSYAFETYCEKSNRYSEDIYIPVKKIRS
ncbi:AraC family transcriptional regulator [Vallitalea okinawensis]|uniref:AraC family transcriptional regulator n=1 Tax=Vallitalea okinawensis TaxID=2078660 RepID=UPI000CFB02D6|nr:helix-turn-helix domain-containing protein [Vallitalea okinawensis]